MAVKIDRKVYKDFVGRTFNIGGTFQPTYIIIANEKVMVPFSEKDAFDYVVRINQPVMFPIPAGTTIDSFIVGGGQSNDDKFKVVLEGEEIVSFTDNGTYVINSLEIKVGE